MPSVGYATLQIIPSVRGIGDELRRQLVGPAGDAGGDAGQAAGSGLRDKVKQGAVVAGAAAGALLVAGIVEALEQSNITKTLQAQLGTTNSVAAAQGKVAGKLYGEGVSGSFQEAADAIKSVVQAGLAPPGTTNKQLQAIATKASDVANVFGQDLGGVTNAVGQMMKTGLAKNSTEAFDIITAGFQSGADKGGDLLDTVNEYGTQFRKAGLSGADAMGLINQAIRAGARDSDVAADAIKEFSIRAVDGSDTTKEGFKALGLSASDMAAKFAKGGETSKAALDLTLDRLRGIKDPVAQGQAAVALFGTQAEDLGKALFAMDPSGAAKELGTFGGAADKVGKTIRSGPSHEITVFTRALKQGVVDFLGGQVLPIISQAVTWFGTYLLPPIRSVASVVASVLGPALSGIVSVGAGVVGWLRDMGMWLAPVGVLVGGLTLLLSANAIATAATTAVFAVYRGAILAWTGVQRAAIAVQAAWNAVMSANPIGLVVIALAALGAALYVAWQKSETFRNIVLGAWEAIQTGALWLWNNALKPAFEGIKTGLSAIGTAASWLWNNVLSPVFNFIGGAARILATVIGTILVTPIVLAVQALGAVFSWLWTNVLSPVIGWIVDGVTWLWTAMQPTFAFIGAAFTAVGSAASWLWTNVLSPVIGWIVDGITWLWTSMQPTFNFIKAAFDTVGKVASWLWNSVIKPVFGWIGDKAVWLWENKIKPAWDLIKISMRLVGDKIKDLWNTYAKPVFGWIGDKAKWLWDKAIKPAFDWIKKGIKAVGKSFEDGKDFIGKAWSKVQDIAKKPVRFIINTVYNRGIVPVWNKIAGAFGAPKIKTMDIRGWATGGVLPGYRTAKSDDVWTPMRSGEGVLVPEVVRGLGAGTIHWLNKLGNTGGAGAVRRATGYARGGVVGNVSTEGFAKGGIFDWIGSAGSALKGLGSKAWDSIKKGAKWLADTLEASARAGVKNIVDPMLARLPGADTGFGKMVRRLPTKMIDTIFGYAKKADDKGAGGGGGAIGGVIPTGRRRSIISQALAAAGVPPPGTMGQWLAGMNTLITRESGWNPRARNNWDINAKNGIPSQGLAQTIPPTWSAYVPNSLRSRGILDPVANVAASIRYIVARYGNITRVQQANANRPPAGYDSGGWLMPGYTATFNGTGQPEAVLTGPQWRAVSALAAQGTTGPAVFEGDLYLDGREFLGRVRGEVHQQMGQLTTALQANRRG